jgi:Rho GDP-dissociation inhibitor
LDDIVAADSGDESLRRYKEQLLGTAMKGDKGDKSDPRQFVITEFRVMFAEDENHADIVHNLDSPAGMAALKADGISMKEGAKFKFKISFRVQHEILVGIKFVNKLSKLVFSNSEELPLGSYGPSSDVRTFEFPEWTYSEAPSGMMFRGTYKANNSIFDGDGKNHLSMEYDVHIKKTW